MSGFADGTLAAAISGTWNAADIQASLGDNYAATKLPEFTLSDGKAYQMGGMANFKLYGVNAETKEPLEAMALSEWLTNKDNQLIRFNERSFAPTNKELSNDTEALSADIAVSAFVYVTLPMSKPILVYTALTTFLVPWGDFILPSIICGSRYDSYTIALGMFKMLEREFISAYYTQFATGAVLVSIPIAALFIFMQRYYVEGVTGGAVKG